MQSRVASWVLLLSFAGAGHAAAQVVLSEPDHLKCYTIRHLQPVEPERITVRVDDQFRGETCEIALPAARFCVETVKRISPNDEGNDPRGGPAGHFLCYNVVGGCEGERVASQRALAMDQFGNWPIQVRRSREVCTPVTKVHPIPTQE